MFGKRSFKLNGDQEREAIEHFRKLIKPWLATFTEDNWPTTASHLHELLHRAMVAEGAQPEWIAFLAQPNWQSDCSAQVTASEVSDRE